MRVSSAAGTTSPTRPVAVIGADVDGSASVVIVCGVSSDARPGEEHGRGVKWRQCATPQPALKKSMDWRESSADDDDDDFPASSSHSDDDVDARAFAALSDDAINASLAPSIYATARALKKHTSAGAFHRLHSIAVDREFVRERATGTFAIFPMFANARAGTWYAPAHAQGCYFKSTDGHCNNWSFSSTRLNAHVALEAASRGGCVIVDATGSNVKRFPDALAKTVPIWADVFNRACAATMSPEDASAWLSPAKDGPFLPHWISDNEKNSIRARLDYFMASFEAVKYDVRPLAAILTKPFRCVWASRDECPIVDVDAIDFTPLILLTASAPLHWRGERRVGINGQSFAYIPGAGDDEESWARGLTPQLFDAHVDALLGMPERDVASFITRIVDGTIATPNMMDPRARLPARGCDQDASVASAMNAADGRMRDGAIRHLSHDCGLGDCAIASIAVYDRVDVHTLADVFIHVGECVVKTPPSTAGCSFTHVVARKVKLDRAALERAVPYALEHIFAALRGTKRTCITCDDGIDHAVAIAVAASLANDIHSVGRDIVDKDAIRARLHRIAQSHPDARPSRGSLKQIYAALNAIARARIE